ncbi:MAG TPA: O-antigen ligase family protein [Acidimicrobiales bacterium]|nr:O-antigen ligase family protein [Acidimicrobiales bacterium]
MSSKQTHYRFGAGTAAAVALLFLAGAAVGLGYALVVIVVLVVFSVVVFWKDRLLDLVIALGILTVSFSGIEIGPVTAPDVFLLPAAVMLGFRHVVSWNKSLPLWLFGSAMTIFAAGILAQVAFVDLPSRSFIILLQLCTSLVYVPLVVALGVRNLQQLQRLSALFVVSASIGSFFGLLEFLGITDVASRLSDFSGFAYNGGRPAGFTAHPNQLGLISVLAFPFAMELFRRNRMWAASLLLLLTGVMISGSRTALAGLLVAAIVTVWVRGTLTTARLLKGAVALVFVGAMATAAGVDVTLDRVFSGDDAVSEATEARTDSVRTALDDIRAHPLTGVGFGGNAHSLYIQIVQGGGILALAGFAWFAQRTLRLARAVRARPLANAAGASMTTWLITGVVHPGLYERYLYVPAGIVLGVHILVRRRTSTSGATDYPTAESASAVSTPAVATDRHGSPEPTAARRGKTPREDWRPSLGRRPE